MKVEFNKRVHEIGKSSDPLFCLGCSFREDVCLGNIGQCFLSLNEIFVYGSYSPLFEL